MASLPMPSWLPGFQDVGAQVLRGYQIGANIRGEEQRLAQQSNMEQMRAALQEQENLRNNLLDQQRLAQQTAYNRQNIALDQAKLAESKRLNDISVQEAARRYQGQQAFSAYMQANPDADPTAAWMQFIAPTAESQGGFGTAARAAWLNRMSLQAPQSSIVTETDPETGEKYKFHRVYHPTTGYSYSPMKTGPDAMEKSMVLARFNQLKSTQNQLRRDMEKSRGKFLPEGDQSELRKEYEELRSEFQDNESELQDLYKEYGPATMSGGQRQIPGLPIDVDTSGRPWEPGAGGSIELPGGGTNRYKILSVTNAPGT